VVSLAVVVAAVVRHANYVTILRDGCPKNGHLGSSHMGNELPCHKIRAQARGAIACSIVSYKVQLSYFRQTGKFLTTAETMMAHDDLLEIWEEIDDLRRLGRLPGLRQGSGRDLFVLVDVPDHPQRILHLVMAPFLDEDDVTPPRTSTGELVPLVRVPLAEIPRTTTRDVVKVGKFDVTDVADMDADTVVASDEEVTPVDMLFPKPPDAPKR
jgi:hypothetical protein